MCVCACACVRVCMCVAATNVSTTIHLCKSCSPSSQVVSGSGDLEVLRLVRRLRVRVGHPEVHYGSHMATHMALGLLFLGGCRLVT